GGAVIAAAFHAKKQGGLIVGEVGLGNIVFRRTNGAGSNVPGAGIVFFAAREKDILVVSVNTVNNSDAVPMADCRSTGDNWTRQNNAGGDAIAQRRRVGIGQGVLDPIEACSPVRKEVAINFNRMGGDIAGG